MTIVPEEPPPPHGFLPIPAFAGRRWSSRIYPGSLTELSGMRHDLRRDLAELSGLTAGTTEDIVLCASELLANAIDHSRSGEPDGHLVRTLTMPEADLLRLGVTDDGHRSTGAPSRIEIPRNRSLEEWALTERGRGLLLVDHLALRWGRRTVFDFPFCQGQGTFLWAEFAVTAPGPGTGTGSATGAER